jgi:hypothetical protein
MPYITNQAIDTGSFIPTTNVWDVSQIYNIEVGSPEFRELLVRLHQNVNNIALVLNTKDSAFYLTQEFNTGQIYFNPVDPSPLQLRPGYRIVINIGALGGGVTSVNHNLSITSTWTFVKISGAATRAVPFLSYPLPFASAANTNIEVTVTATQVVINNTTAVTFTSAYIVLEYLKY